MKFKIGSYIIVHDPKNYFFPEHNFHGRIGQVISKNSATSSDYVVIQFIKLIEDKFIGTHFNVPYSIESEEKWMIPLDMDNNLIRLVCSTQ